MTHASDNPLDALSDALAFNSRDFGTDQFEAWIWGIVHGWDDEDGELDCGDVMSEVAAKVGWSEQHVASLRRLRSNFRRLEALAPTLLELPESADSWQLPRRIETADELDALPFLSIVREIWRASPVAGVDYGPVWERRASDWERISGGMYDPGTPALPVLLLWTAAPKGEK